MSKINILHDGSFDIAIGKGRKDTSWKNKQMTWTEFVQKVSSTQRTHESYSEYLAAKKSRQDEIKDVGGYVGGYLNGGRRKNGSVVHRQLITLDVDYATLALWEDFILIYDCAAVLYSTHKHSSKTPRYRLIIPVDRELMTDEYTAVSRRIAGQLGIELFDHTTFQPTRLMYWPSTSKDGEYQFEYQDGPWLNADEILESYHDWKDSSEWPVSSKESIEYRVKNEKQEDPTTKTGPIGAFCRTYGMHEAIENFLSDVYETCDIPARYTYKEGSTAAGLIVYDDKFAYSHHGTDPASGHLCNAFDLVRIHKFGAKDETKEDQKKSFDAMVSFATKDPEVIRTIVSEKMESAAADFSDMAEDETEEDLELWKEKLDIDRKGNVYNTIDNIAIVLENDPYFKNRIAYDDFEKCEVAVKNLPWRKITHQTRRLIDQDDANIRHYLERKYGISSALKIKDAMSVLSNKKSFHPVRDYLNSVEWGW
jgi:putative DNA primase/helicase